MIVLLAPVINHASLNIIPLLEKKDASRHEVFDIQAIDERLQKLQALKLLHTKEKFFDAHIEESKKEEQEFIKKLNVLDQGSPYQQFINGYQQHKTYFSGCDDNRFLPADLIELRKKRIFYNIDANEAERFRDKDRTITDEQYCENSNKYRQQLERIEHARQLQQLKSKYHMLEKEVQTYDQYLKSTTSKTTCTHRTYGYNSYTDHYETEWEERPMKYGITPRFQMTDSEKGFIAQILNNPDVINTMNAMANNTNNFLNAINNRLQGANFSSLQDLDNAIYGVVRDHNNELGKIKEQSSIDLYASNVVDQFLQTWTDQNQSRFNITCTHDQTNFVDSLTKKFEQKQQAVATSTVIAKLGIVSTAASLAAHYYFKNK